MSPELPNSEGSSAESPGGGQVADGLELAPGIRVRESAVRFQYARSSGPGGQNVNKVNTKTEVWVPLAGCRRLAIPPRQWSGCESWAAGA